MSKQIYEVIRVTEKGGVDRKNYVSSFRRAQGTKELLVDECEKDSIDAAVIILDGNHQIVEMSLTGKYASQDGNMNTHKDETKAGNKVTRVAKRVIEKTRKGIFEEIAKKWCNMIEIARRTTRKSISEARGIKNESRYKKSS